MWAERTYCRAGARRRMPAARRQRPLPILYKSSPAAKGTVYYYVHNAQGESCEDGVPLVIAGKKGVEATETKGLRMKELPAASI